MVRISASPDPEAPRTYRQLAALPGIAALLAAMCLARLAESMFALAIVLLVLERFRAPSLAGWAAFLAMAPGLALSPIAGAVLDRIGPARAIAVDLAVSAGLLVAMTLAAGHLSALFLLVALYSLTSPLTGAGLRTLLPLMVPPAAADRANALDTAGWSAIEAAGPALCGLLFALCGGRATLLVVALLYALAVASLIGLLRRPVAVPRDDPGPLWREALAGLRQVARDRSLRGLALAYSAYQIAWGVMVPTVPVVLHRTLDTGRIADLAVGGLWALAGAASGLGALAAGRRSTAGRERRLLIGGMLLSAAALWPLGGSFGIAGLGLALPLIGLFAGPIDVGLLSLRQRRTDPARLGRVLAVSMSLNMSGMPLGAALGGILVAHSSQAAFAAAALAAVLGALAALAIPADHNRNGISAGVWRR